MTTLDNVTLHKKSNVYFEGKCVSHTVTMADGSRSTVGVIFPSLLAFNTAAAETMEIVSGKCKVKLPGDEAWHLVEGGQQFHVAANSSFEIETLELVDYVCHFG
ncbi:MAG: pyrimidine/purine nucleoside phosphorylase [Massilia sp.]